MLLYGRLSFVALFLIVSISSSSVATAIGTNNLMQDQTVNQKFYDKIEKLKLDGIEEQSFFQSCIRLLSQKLDAAKQEIIVLKNDNYKLKNFYKNVHSKVMQLWQSKEEQEKKIEHHEQDLRLHEVAIIRDEEKIHMLEEISK